MTSPDHYEILQVHPKASAEIIKRAYRTLCGLYHPDIVPPQERAEADRKMALINAAYAVLIDPSARREYDKSRLGAHPASVPQVPSATTQAGAVDARKCYLHPERARVSVCMICGHSICGECRRAEAMVVMCPDCTKRLDSGSVRAGSPRKASGAGADTVAARISSQTSPIAVLLRAHWFFKTLSGLVVAIAFAATIPLFMMAAVSMVALRFPMQTGLIWAVSIIISALAAVLVSVLLVITGAFLRLRYMLLALVVLLAAMAVGLHQVRQAEEPYAAVTELQAGRYTTAAIRFTFALAMGEQDQDTWDGLGRTYLRLYLEEANRRPDSVSRARATYARGALEALHRSLLPSDEPRQPGRRDTIVLSPGESVAVYLAAKTTSDLTPKMLRWSTKWWAQAGQILLLSPELTNKLPSDPVRRMTLGLTCFRHWQTIESSPAAEAQRIREDWRSLGDLGQRRRTAAERNRDNLLSWARTCIDLPNNQPLNAELEPLRADLDEAWRKVSAAADQGRQPRQQRQQPVPHEQQPSAQGQQPDQPGREPALRPQQPTTEGAQPDASARTGS